MRYRARPHKDKKIFKTTATKTNKMNATRSIPRGGIRL